MKRKIIVSLAVVACFALYSCGEARRILPVPLSKMAEFNAKTGGLVDPPADAKKLVLVDARVKDKHTLENYVKAAEQRMFLDCEIREKVLDGSSDPVKTAFAVKKNGAGAVMLFCERPDMPVLSVFPEDAVVVLNLQPMQDPDEIVYRRRMSKQFWRALGFALGGYGNPVQVGSVMQPVFSPEDLDAIKGISLSPPQMNAVLLSRIKLKIYGKRSVPYSRACREGWAPAPTNEVQRAFYEKAKDPVSRFKSELDVGGNTSKAQKK